MTWGIVAVVVGIVGVWRMGGRRRERFTVGPSEPISTMHMSMARKRTSKTKDALDAASAVLR